MLTAKEVYFEAMVIPRSLSNWLLSMTRSSLQATTQPARVGIGVGASVWVCAGVGLGLGARAAGRQAQPVVTPARHLPGVCMIGETSTLMDAGRRGVLLGRPSDAHCTGWIACLLPGRKSHAQQRPALVPRQNAAASAPCLSDAPQKESRRSISVVLPWST